MKLTKLLAIHFGLCNQNTARYHRSILLFPVYFNLRTNERNDSFGIIFGTNHKQLVADVENSITVRNAHMSVLKNTRTYKVTSHKVFHLKQGLSRQCLIMHFKMHHSGGQMRIGRLFLGNSLLFFLQIDTANVANGNDGADNTQHTKRISTSISHRYLRTVITQLRQSFVGGTKSGSIRHRTAKNTHHHRQFDTSVQSVIQAESNSYI